MSNHKDASSSLVPVASPTPEATDPAATDLPSLHHAEIATARRYADASRAASTQRAYASDWQRFSAWCLARGIETLPADPRAVAVFLSAEAEAELVALRFADIERVPEGLRVTIRRSKTDQDAAGATIAIPEGRRLRPKALLDAWLERDGISDGFLFRRLVPAPAGGATPFPMSDRAVARLVQLRVAQAGYVATDFAGHSLRSGFLTAAARSGASVFKMREVSRHKSMQVLADYVRDAELFRDHAGEDFL